MILLPPTTLVCDYEQISQYLAIAWKFSWPWAKPGRYRYFWTFLVDTWVLTKVSVGCSQETLYIDRTGLELSASLCKAKLWWGIHHIIKPKCAHRHGSRNCIVKPENNSYKYTHKSPINVLAIHQCAKIQSLTQSATWSTILLCFQSNVKAFYHQSTGAPELSLLDLAWKSLTAGKKTAEFLQKRKASSVAHLISVLTAEQVSFRKALWS